MEAARREYGLYQPVVIQYLNQLKRVATLDLGNSYARGQPVGALIAEHFAPTLVLTAVALGAAWVLAVVGAVVAVRRGGVEAHAILLVEGEAWCELHF